MSVCEICSSTLNGQNPLKGGGTFYDCPQCGEYGIKYSLTSRIPQWMEFNEHLHLIAGYLNETKNERSPLTFDEFNFRKILTTGIIPKSISEKIFKLLNKINSITTYIGELVDISPADAYAKNFDEFIEISDYLKSKKYIANLHRERDKTSSASITIDGVLYIGEHQYTIPENQCFIAMWFGSELETAWEYGIKPACISSGYFPQRIDKENFNNDIIDEILARIRVSDFIIADLTGDRSGVYYEAGFAKGLEKEVILSCRKDWFDNEEEGRKVHFDVNHNNIIIWEDIDEFRQELQNRIEATIGKGNYAITETI